MNFCLVLLDLLAVGLDIYVISLHYGTMILNTVQSICLCIAAFHMVAQYLMVKKLLELTLIHHIPPKKKAPITTSSGIE